MDDLISEFLTETNESLDELDLDLVNLEQNPNDKDLLSKIFRLMHTIKGTCGFLGLPRLEKVAHHAENVLGRFRDGDLEVTPDYVTLIFESIDKIKFIVKELENTGSEPSGDDSALIEKLDAVYEGRELPKDEPAPAAAPEPESVGNGIDPNLDPFANLKPGEAALHTNIGETTESSSETEETAEQEDIPVENPDPTPAPAAGAANDQPATKDAPVATTQTLRVNVDVLENLMTMVSELVLTRNQLMQILRTAQTDGDNEFSAPLQRLNHVVSDLQEGVMKTRMQPIGNAWSKLPRIIRDLSLELGKKIDLEMRGQDTELDRQVLEFIKDPLTHMVRNSADHGIEMPADRKAAGKPETGRVLLNAFHEGGHIIIEITDDGKGLSSEKIKKKVAENGLATAEELEAMNDSQIHQYIFHAGLSTAEKVTAVSGRGVGMDVVRTNIEKIGGSIELKSKEGKGSTFTIKIPLTLAIVSALIVEAKGEKYAIPQLAVRELVMTSVGGDNRIEMIKGTPVFRLRERLLPLVTLSELLKLKDPSQMNGSADLLQAKKSEDEDHQDKSSDSVLQNIQSSSQNHYIVVTQVGTYNFGIIVDKVFDTEEIVVKPVAKILRDIDIFSGNTILGDGSVIMILDPNGIAKATGEASTADEAELAAASNTHYESSLDKTSLLLFSAGGGAPKAVPLSLVARLENIDMSKIEISSGQRMIQYRGELMPLMPFNASMDVPSEGEKPCLVFADKKMSVGLLVDEIIDIKEEVINVQVNSHEKALIGSAIINEKATDVIDVGYFLRTVNKDWFKDHDDTPYHKGNGAGNGSDIRRVLLVDDSPFFRNMLTPLLSVAGYNVTSLESPLDALKMCEKGEKFDVIISDIEMPEMDGFEFAEKVQENSNWQNTPMVALSSHATQEDISRGMEVGFKKYVAKFDRDTLLDTLSETLTETQRKAS